MKTNMLFLIIISFLFISCETLIEKLGNFSLSLQPDISNNSQSETPDTYASQNRIPIISNQRTKIDPGRRAIQDTSNWDIANLDTAANADYLTDIEKDVILEMNKVRTDPKKYAELYIQPRLRYYNGKNYSVPGQITIMTSEGASAVNICITALSRANSAGVLIPELGLSRAAKDHVTDQSRTGQTGHDGSDRSTPKIRMERYGSFARSFTLGENIAYGPDKGRDIVIDLLVDDGVPSRGHRINIMNKAFTQTGVAFGTHTQYRTSCTITYADGYTSN